MDEIEQAEARRLQRQALHQQGDAVPIVGQLEPEFGLLLLQRLVIQQLRQSRDGVGRADPDLFDHRGAVARRLNRRPQVLSHESSRAKKFLVAHCAAATAGSTHHQLDESLLVAKE